MSSRPRRLDLEAEPAKRQEIAVHGAEPRRRHLLEGAEHGGKAHQSRAQFAPGHLLAVIDLAAERLAIGAVELQMIAGGRQRRRRDIARRIGKPVRLEIESVLDAAVEQVEEMRDGADLESGREFLRARAAAQFRCAFEHQNLEPALCEPGRGGEPVGAAADDDRIIGRHRARSSWLAI